MAASIAVVATKRSAFGLKRKSKGVLVERMIRQEFGLIDAKLIQAEASHPVCIKKLDNDQHELWVLPIHVACSIATTPLEVLQSIIDAFPEGLTRHTTLSEDKSATSTRDELEGSNVSTLWVESRDTSRTTMSTDNLDGWAGGWLPLHAAVWHGISVPGLQTILRRCPASIYCKTSQGCLALHLACTTRKTSPQLIAALVETFPDSVYVPTNDGSLPADIVQDNHTGQIVEEILTLVKTGNKPQGYKAPPRCVQSIPSSKR